MDLENIRLTPAMQQFKDMKDEYPDCMLLMRMGDFYELFYDDAITAAKVLGITLTSRGKGESKAPLAGIPYHALDSYLGKLVEAGIKVAICEQLEDPKKAKGLVKRGVIRVITPGTLFEENLLQKEEHNFIVGIRKEFGRWGLSYCDISTGECAATECETENEVRAELERIAPQEIVLPLGENAPVITMHAKTNGIFISTEPEAVFWAQRAQAMLKRHFGVETLEGFGLSKLPVASSAAGGLLFHLHQTQKQALAHITGIRQYSTKEYMELDVATIRNLELLKKMRDQGTKHTLFETLNETATPMGSRLLKQWIIRPLVKREEIELRNEAVEFFTKDVTRLRKTQTLLSNTGDLLRLLSKLHHGKGNARDTLAVAQCIENFEEIIEAIGTVALAKDGPSHTLHANQRCPPLINYRKSEACTNLRNKISTMIAEDPPAQTNQGGMIAPGVNEELDRLRTLRDNATEVIRTMEEDERVKHNIASLKIRYNRVFGYFIEVTNKYKNSVPEYYQRKQTTAQGERYITPELKKIEEELLGAEEKIISKEAELLAELIVDITRETKKLQKIAHALATLDVTSSLAECALQNNYTRPEFTENKVIELIGARHPVVERGAKRFVPNDCVLNSDKRLLLITGPNMAGKSTYLRQTALIVLMAQIGSFVPCTKARMQVTDRIFTRIGAYDDLAQGQSTFMIEMAETANILNHATENSLVILDEIGRGTSTYDGVSIAQAVFEALHETVGCKGLFATHYHHLNNLTKRLSNVANVHVAVRESEEGITFLHKIVEGGTDKSYGIHVAKIAGVPKEVIRRAGEIMKRIETLDVLEEALENPTVKKKEGEELGKEKVGLRKFI